LMLRKALVLCPTLVLGGHSNAALTVAVYEE
jgi:hypothetical protein